MHKQTIPMKELAELIRLQLENGGKAHLNVTGSSMLPTLRAQRDSVLLTVPAQRQKKGDIILYLRENGQYVLHRIIEVEADGYICCGDNQLVREQVKHSQVLAVVSGMRRNGKVYQAQSCAYRTYAAVCTGLFPMRKFYLPLRRRLGRLKKRLLRS